VAGEITPPQQSPGDVSVRGIGEAVDIGEDFDCGFLQVLVKAAQFAIPLPVEALEKSLAFGDVQGQQSGLMTARMVRVSFEIRAHHLAQQFPGVIPSILVKELIRGQAQDVVPEVRRV